MSQKIYDVTIKFIDKMNCQTVFLLPEGQERCIRAQNAHWCEGQRGTLAIDDENELGTRFWAYAEQRLRKVGELDPAQTPRGNIGQFIWQLEGSSARIFTPAGFVPGIGGRFIVADTEPLELDIPKEFIDLCESRGQTPASVLKGLIADLCGLINYQACPREDGYNSNGSDERGHANEWFDRAYPEAEPLHVDYSQRSTK